MIALTLDRQTTLQTGIPRLVIAAPASGSGKSTVACGLMAALSRDGTVQGFKVGPDYIDPGYHTAACGRIARNLDTWMVDRDRVAGSFVTAAQGADVAVVEGVMGLFDGYDALSEQGSTAEIAKLIQAPVVLVLDAGKMARSAGAVAVGFRDFDPALYLGGVICNNVGSERHADLVTRSVEAAGVPVLGCLPRTDDLYTPERHLGLQTAGERQSTVAAFMQRAAELVHAHIDLARLWELARAAPPLAVPSPAADGKTPDVRTHNASDAPVPIAVARDEAFCFYYEDNFDYLRAAGAELVEFSPLHDRALPADAAGIYLGGGYPELYAAQLAGNHALLDALRQAVAAGTPTYAECGGLMVLTERLVDLQGDEYPMLGLLPGYTAMRERVRLGYREVTARRDTVLLAQGERARGHEFHYSDWIKPERALACAGLVEAYEVTARRLAPASRAGVAAGNLLASYIHLHFAANPAMARRFVAQCRHWRQAPVSM